MRPAYDVYDAEVLACATPIYDALYSEHRRLFRAVPGDRTAEGSPYPDGCALQPRGQERPDLPQQQARRSYTEHRRASPTVPAQHAGHSPNGQGRVAARATWTVTPPA